MTADELLAGSALTYEVAVPARLLASGGEATGGTVRLRPLTVHDLQLIARAAKERDALAGALMVQASLVDPPLSVAQVGSLQVGLLQFLLGEVNRISGISADPASVQDAAEDPLVRAAFLLSREFGWTPDQVGALTLGQVLLHLQMLKEQKAANG